MSRARRIEARNKTNIVAKRKHYRQFQLDPKLSRTIARARNLTKELQEMRLFSFLMIAIVSCTTESIAEVKCVIPRLEQGMAYSLVRTIVVNAGFFAPSPVGGYKAEDDKVQTECHGDLALCNKFPEIEACSADGFCKMHFEDTRKNKITIITFGDTPIIKDVSIDCGGQSYNLSKSASVELSLPPRPKPPKLDTVAKLLSESNQIRAVTPTKPSPRLADISKLLSQEAAPPQPQPDAPRTLALSDKPVVKEMACRFKTENGGVVFHHLIREKMTAGIYREDSVSGSQKSFWTERVDGPNTSLKSETTVIQFDSLVASAGEAKWRASLSARDASGALIGTVAHGECEGVFSVIVHGRSFAELNAERAIAVERSSGIIAALGTGAAPDEVVKSLAKEGEDFPLSLDLGGNDITRRFFSRALLSDYQTGLGKSKNCTFMDGNVLTGSQDGGAMHITDSWISIVTAGSAIVLVSYTMAFSSPSAREYRSLFHLIQEDGAWKVDEISILQPSSRNRKMQLTFALHDYLKRAAERGCGA